MPLVYVVTGASRGLGLEFVKQIVAAGNHVFACARNPDSSSELSKLVDNEKVYAIKLDTSNEESIKAAAEEINFKAPEGVDILINNAGIGGQMGTNYETVTKQDMLKVFETNVTGVNETTKAFVPLLRKRPTKKILNMSSVLGSISEVEDSTGSGFGIAYGVSKTALNMLTKLTAKQLESEGFVVYASHPGWVQTAMGGPQAPLTAEVSIRGQLAKIDSLTVEDNGKFYDYEGKPIAW
ncbi:4-dihydrotrisporin dehydrogenase [Gilbertella persicaria]|uniref:4-dihydrotrisporin dehydrogenase n=1 Tax=Gilbertella persicaria TaxID=101096 RepID=UPI00221FFF91|nr:4-dihydrotrisporin dehydrogenase [Gilbertella persicaria]KAI8048598.1 4-dihydrotrisporin dehydrogenase [Gilbertella persicaria]